MNYKLFVIEDNKPFPNSDLPVIVYQKIFKEDKEDYGDDFLNEYKNNGWGESWRSGVYPYHHYHSNAHEALGCAKGWIKVQLGGEGGEVYTLEKGEAILLPAGVVHCRIDASSDYAMIGGYPPGQSPDMNTGMEEEYERNKDKVATVKKPLTDPYYGEGGPAVIEWSK